MNFFRLLPCLNLSVAVTALLLTQVSFAQDEEGEKPADAPAETSEDATAGAKDLATRVSYAYGLNIGSDLGRQLTSLGEDLNIEIDTELFVSALVAGMKGEEAEMSNDEVAATITEVRTLIQESRATGKDKETLLAGKKFLEENGAKEGVKATASGLQYEVLKEGEGVKPSATDRVKVHYHGTLTDGTVFDSSVERGEPTSFFLNRVIPGWTEGVQLMPEGAKFRFTIPYHLAYGAGGSPPKIPPYSALIFEVELLDVEGK